MQTPTSLLGRSLEQRMHASRNWADPVLDTGLARHAMMWTACLTGEPCSRKEYWQRPEALQGHDRVWTHGLPGTYATHAGSRHQRQRPSRQSTPSWACAGATAPVQLSRLSVSESRASAARLTSDAQAPWKGWPANCMVPGRARCHASCTACPSDPEGHRAGFSTWPGAAAHA